MRSIKFFSIRLLLFGLVCLAGSCKKFLDKKPNENLATPSTLSDLQAMLDNTAIMNTAVTPSLPEASADDYFLPDNVLATRSETVQAMYRWAPVDYFFLNDWAAAYEPVYNANLCLEELDAIPVQPGDAVARDNIRGSALFFRARSFLELCWAFADAYDAETAGERPGIDLRLGSDFNVPSMRASVADCYAQVLSDLRAAAAILPGQSVHVTRPSKSAAYGLLARCFLSMRRYDSAGVYADKALAGFFTLIDYNTVANTASPFASLAYGGETLFFSTMVSFNAFDLVHNTRALIDTQLYASYALNDLRRTRFFRANGRFQAFKGTYNTDARYYFTGIAADELYLMRAECAARAGEADQALSDLNTLLEKRFSTGTFVPHTERDPAALLDLVLLERRKELLMRGLRWMDIKRLNKEGRGIIPQRLIGGELVRLLPDDGYYALPLPADIIQLTGMPQNEGKRP